MLNSFNTQMARELRAALDESRADKTVRAVLLTGRGRAFVRDRIYRKCLRQRKAKRSTRCDGSRDYNPVIKSLRKLELPVICAVNGVAAGAGANLALACDIVFASETASSFSVREVGLIPDSSGTYFLPRKSGFRGQPR